MAGKFRLEINVSGFNEVRKSPGVVDALESHAERIAATAGGAPDFVVVRSDSRTRARFIVVTATLRGRMLEADERALTRAFGA